ERPRRQRPGLDAVPGRTPGRGPALRPGGRPAAQPRPPPALPRRCGRRRRRRAGRGPGVSGDRAGTEPRVLRALRPGGPAPPGAAAGGGGMSPSRKTVGGRAIWRALGRAGRRGVAGLAGSVLALALALGLPAVAAAHPLGNFTVNHYSRLELTPGAVRVRYV